MAATGIPWVENPIQLCGDSGEFEHTNLELTRCQTVQLQYDSFYEVCPGVLKIRV